jgi:hypothetical protein
MKKPMRYLAILSIISLLFSCSSKDQTPETTVSNEDETTRKTSVEQDELKYYNDSMIASSKELSTIKAFIDSASKYYDSIPYTFKYKGQRYYMPVAELSQEKDVVHYKKIG